MKLIENWRAAWSHYSTLALTAATALPALWAANPELHGLIPAEKLALVTGVITALGLVGKFIRQGDEK